MTLMEKLKLLINRPDATEELLELYLDRAQETILGYCNIDKLPNGTEPAVLELAAFYFNRQGIEGTLNYSEGCVSYGFAEGIPKSITSRIQRYVQGKVMTL